MPVYLRRPSRRKHYSFAEIPADLFAWADTQSASVHLPETFAERALMKRLRMPLHMARVIAENASIGGHQ